MWLASCEPGCGRYLRIGVPVILVGIVRIGRGHSVCNEGKHTSWNPTGVEATNLEPVTWVELRHRSTASRSSNTLRPTSINGRRFEQKGRNTPEQDVPGGRKRGV